MASALVIISALLLAAAAEDTRRDGLIDRLHNGMKFAQGLLGSESVALKVAEFVVRAFNPGAGPGSGTTPHTTTPRPADSQQPYHEDSEKNEYDSPSESRPPMAALRQLVRLLGLQPGQLGAVAVNALLFVSQLIATFLAGPVRPGRGRPHRVEDASSWLLQRDSQPLHELLAVARNDTLADTIQDIIKAQGPAEETSCLRLLACKIAPFVVSMQSAVFGPPPHDGVQGLKGSAALYRHLPSKEEVGQRSDICEAAHSDCHLNEL